MSAEKLASQMHQHVVTSILNANQACRDAADIIHGRADERCNSCAWNTTVSDEFSVTRNKETRVDVDHWIELGDTYQECPWCGLDIDKAV